MTLTSAPESLVVFTVLAYSRPVCSCTGSPSKSVRMRTVGPSPFFSVAANPVPPIGEVISYPSGRNSEMSFPAVSASWNESSGLRCR